MPREESDRERDVDPDRERRRRERRQSRGEDYDRERRRRKGHRATDSQGDLLPRPSPARRQRHSESEWDTSPSPRKTRRHSNAHDDSTPSGSRSRGSAPLSLDAIAKLDKHNQKKAGWGGYDYDEDYLKEVRRKEEKLERQRQRDEKDDRRKSKVAREEREKRKEELRRLREVEEREKEERRRKYEAEAAAMEEAKLKRERKKEEREKEKERRRTAAYTDDERDKRSSYLVNAERDKRGSYTDAEREEKRRRYEQKYTPSERDERRERRREEKKHRTEQKKRRVISGPLAEEGGVADDESDEYRYMMEKRGGGRSAPSEYSEDQLARRKKWKRIAIIVLAILLVLAIVIPVAVMMSKKNNKGTNESNAAADSSKPSNGNLDGIDKSSIPADKQGTIYDPFSWYDTSEFNVTYTDKTVGGLPVMGLNNTWDDDIAANDKVPKLSEAFEYGKMPIRGVNVGGWLNIEPFITPSFFEQYSSRDGIVDEYTLCSKLGTDRCKESLEKHYSAFVTRQTFEDIRDAGFDHVRIPFGYWIVTTYEGDPYVKQVSWRYLLRGIEWARQNGLRINLDLHGAPGSQNGWNHSGRQGSIGWLNGTDGDLNAQRTLDIHHQLSQFFAQPRYKNIVTMYGIVNEPRMVDIDTSSVISWTTKAIQQIRKDNITAVLVFGDGFFGLDNWQGRLQDDDNLLLDVHQYVIFNVDQLSLKHTDKLNFACRGWTQQAKRSMDKTTGFGPTMCGEWSQADTDCTEYINNVNIGTRWEGTYDTGNTSTSILKPQCPNLDDTCTCDGANTDPSNYSDAYKKWLYQFAVAQMISFEVGWGWFYWTWETEKATQWSWKLGMKAGILPSKVWDRDFDCPTTLDDFEELGLSETYKRSSMGW
jgi:glucan 1,3-beta-glucosidase